MLIVEASLLFFAIASAMVVPTLQSDDDTIYDYIFESSQQAQN